MKSVPGSIPNMVVDFFKGLIRIREFKLMVHIEVKIVLFSSASALWRFFNYFYRGCS